MKFFRRNTIEAIKPQIQHVNDLTHIDCQGLAGAWTLGSAQAGFELQHRASLGAFGDSVIASNRHLVPGPWEQDPGASVEEWEPATAAYLTGTPPCSGFSLLNNSKKGNKRGADSGINDCMKELIAYAGRCRGLDGKFGPEVVAFESVQGAFSQGRSLMQFLRDDLERRTGNKYDLSHVLLAGATIGAAQMRHRYYFVAHRIPFGVDEPERRQVVTYKDAIGDLIGLEDTWDLQRVKRKGSHEGNWWLHEQGIIAPDDKDHYFVRDHMGADNPRIRILLNYLEPYWPAGKGMEFALRAYRDANGEFPEGTERWWNHDEDILKGFAHPTRIHPDKCGYVCTGGCAFDFMHWKERRMLSVRETARMMGYPDSWSWDAAQSVTQASAWVGKCCPVQSGRWISSWVARAIQGNPGAPLEKIGEREYYHNNTSLYRKWLKEQQNA